MNRKRGHQFKRGVIACAISSMLFSQGAWAHTTSVGYENAGPGAVNFWYGTYHFSNFTEGSMQLVGPNGFDVTTPFTLVVQTKPEGLIDGETNFYSNGTGLTGDIIYSGGEAAWQGVSFTNLTAGDYTFTYIPISTPTQDWAPMDNIILSSSVTLTAELLGGSGFVQNSTSTSSSTATLLDSITDNATGQMADVITLLNAMDDPSQQKALQRIAPNSGSAMGMGSLQVVTGVLDTVAVRLDGIRSQGFTISAWDELNNGGKIMLAANGDTSGLLSGDPSLKHSLWVKGFGSRADQDLKDGFAGYRADTGGLAIGSDMLLANQWVVGGAFTFANTDVSMTDYRTGDSSKIDTYQFTAYATRDFGKFYTEGMLGYAVHNYETARDTTLTGIARGDFDGSQYAARLTVGMPIAIPYNLTLTPLAGLEWNQLKQDGYAETGAGALNMQVQSVSADRVRSMLGAKLSTDMLVKSYTVRPSVQAAWRHEFKNDGIDTTSTFTGGGGAFTTAGQDLEENTFSLGVGVAVSKSDRAMMSFQLDTEQASGYSAYAGQVVAQWKF